jgi:hypothetical protein
MTEVGIREYFESIKWFDAKFDKGEDIQVIIQDMWQAYPAATMHLLKEGFFMALALRN